MAEPTYEDSKQNRGNEKQTGAAAAAPLEFRVRRKGGLSVYGLGRFPSRFYYEVTRSSTPCSSPHLPRRKQRRRQAQAQSK